MNIGRKEWVDAGLAILFYLSCFLLTINVLVVSFKILAGEAIPARNYILFLVSSILWSAISYFSKEVWWKTLIKMSLYSLALISIFLIAASIFVFIKSISNSGDIASFVYIPVLFTAGVSLYVGVTRALKSQFLN